MPDLHLLADTTHGQGHVSRCLGLADAWMEREYGEVYHVESKHGSGDILYSDWQGDAFKSISKSGYDYTVAAHDGISGDVFAHMVVCFEYEIGTPFDINRNYAPIHLEGFQYFPLRKELWDRQWSYRDTRRIGIVPGSASTMNVGWIADWIAEWRPPYRPVILQDLPFEEFIEEALSCKLIICPASTVAVELTSCGVPCNIMVTVRDQVTLFNSLIYHGYCRPFREEDGYLGWEPPRNCIPQDGALKLADAIYEGWIKCNE